VVIGGKGVVMMEELAVSGVVTVSIVGEARL
jgi:hypothetical protein